MKTMSEKLISLESVLKEIRRFKGYIDDDMIERFSIAFKRLSPVELPMRADVYLWQRERMCHSFDKATYDPSIDQCEDCPLIDCCSKRGCLEDAEAVDIVEKWTREHPEEGSDNQ